MGNKLHIRDSDTIEHGLRLHGFSVPTPLQPDFIPLLSALLDAKIPADRTAERLQDEVQREVAEIWEIERRHRADVLVQKKEVDQIHKLRAENTKLREKITKTQNREMKLKFKLSAAEN